jgi:Cu/Ag efflux protein CusF
MKKVDVLYIFLFISGIITASVVAQSSSSGSSQSKDGNIAWTEVTRTGTIENVDTENHKVTIKDTDGKLYILTVSPRINIDELNKGDRVSATFFHSVALDVREPTDEDRKNPLQIEEGMIPPPPNAPPEVTAVRQIKALVKVVERDPSNQTVVVSGPEGRSVAIQIPDKEMFDTLKMGKEAVIMYTEAIAVKIDKV